MAEGPIASFDLDEVDLSEAVESIRKTFDVPLVLRRRFRMREDFVGWLRSGRKVTTIRVAPGGVDFPSDRSLDLVAVGSYAQTTGDAVGRSRIERMVIKPAGSLTKADANRDGFGTLDDLTDALRAMYGENFSNEYVTIYQLALSPEG